MEKHKAIKVGIVGVEVSRLVEGVVVFDVRADLHLMTDPIFDDGAEGVDRGAFGQRKFRVSIRHAFGPNENKVE